MTKPIRLLLVVNVFPPDQCGGAVLFNDLAEGLSARGFEVTVRTAYAYYPEWQDKMGLNGWRIRKETHPHFQLERYGLYIPRHPKALFERLLYEASFYFSLLRSLPRSRSFDVVMVVCPLIGSIAFGAAIKEIFRKPLWLNVQDISAEAAAASGIVKSGWVTKLLNTIQNWLFNHADVWSSVSPVMVDQLRPLRTRNQPLQYIANWLHDSVEQIIGVLPSKLGRLPQETVQLFYSGNIGAKQDLLAFCQFLHQSTLPFHFRIHGSGGEAATIQAWIAQTGDTRFVFGELLEETAFIQTLHDADFFVITEKQGVGGSFIPSKMIPGIATGTPILAVSDQESPFGREMQESRAGIHLTWNGLAALPILWERIRQNPALFREWQENALKRSAWYRRDGVIDRYAAGLRALAHRDFKTLNMQ